MTITTKSEIVYFTMTLPQGEYEVDHLSPWGPVITERNPLGHMLVVPRRYVK